jgi:hypothetical protein
MIKNSINALHEYVYNKAGVNTKFDEPMFDNFIGVNTNGGFMHPHG